MPSLRDRLLEPADRHEVELASRRGLYAGLLQAALYLVAFTALVVLGLATDLVGADYGDGGPSALLFWGAVLSSIALGAGMVGLATTERVGRVWRVPAARLVTVAAVYAAFFGLAVADFASALVAGPGFVVARIAAHLWLIATRS